MLGKNHIEQSKRLYHAVLHVLGAGPGFENTNKAGQRRLFYRHEGASSGVSEPIDGKPATVGNGGTVGFECHSPEQVRKFHDVAVANGGTSIEEPLGPRSGVTGVPHLAYVRDPDGNKLCALYRQKHSPGFGRRLVAAQCCR